MSDVAVVIESRGSSMSKNRQTVMFRFEDDVVIFSRLADGKQGLGNRWELVDLDELLSSLHDDEVLTRSVTGVEVTLSDYTKYRETGRIQVLGVKSVSALLKADLLTEDYQAAHAIYNWYGMCEDNSPELVSLVVKGASSTPQQTNPIQQEGETMSAMAPRLQMSLASIPRKEIGERYINRKLSGNLYDFEVYDYARQHKRNVLLYGPTGPGKTMSIEAWCAIRGIRCVTVSGNAALEPSQFFGKRVPSGDPQNPFPWIDGPITDVVRNGGVIILDELNFINMKIITPLYPLTDARRSITLLEHNGEVIEAHPDVTIFATMNPNYIGTAPVTQAFRNRFDIQIPWDYDYDVEAKLLKSKYLLEVAKQLRAEADKGMYDTPIATNMLIELEEMIAQLNYEFATENFIAHFSDEEQSSIRLVFQTYEHNIKSDLGIAEDVVLEHASESIN